MRLPGLGNTNDFRYDPDADLNEFRDKNGNLLFRYRYSPDKPVFCLCKTGILGLFVPEDTAGQFDIMAFSDKTKDLLVFGKCLGRTQRDSRFTGIQAEWDGFCHETEGWDAVLVAHPASSVGHRLFDCSGGGEVPPHRFRKGEESSYDKDHLALVPLVKTICKNLPEAHPARAMWIFRTPQTVTYECVKETWKMTVDNLCQLPFFEGSWQNLIEKWGASSFHPLLEGLSERICESAEAHFLSKPPDSPFDWIDGKSREWLSFVAEWIKRTPPYPEKFYDAAWNLCKREKQSKTEKRKKDLADCVASYSRKFESFKSCSLGDCHIGRTFTFRQLGFKTGVALQRAICHEAKI